jgi:hypothetical protein
LDKPALPRQGLSLLWSTQGEELLFDLPRKPLRLLLSHHEVLPAS